MTSHAARRTPTLRSRANPPFVGPPCCVGPVARSRRAWPARTRGCSMASSRSGNPRADAKSIHAQTRSYGNAKARYQADRGVLARVIGNETLLDGVSIAPRLRGRYRALEFSTCSRHAVQRLWCPPSRCVRAPTQLSTTRCPRRALQSPAPVGSKLSCASLIGGYNLGCKMRGTTSRAIDSTTGTTTELPNCR